MDAILSELILKVQNISERLSVLEGQTLQDIKQESYYQNYLEHKLGATHNKNIYGIVNIETDNSVIEIKDWKHFKYALGQLVSYTKVNNKRRIVYFFGQKPGLKQVNAILDLFNDYNVEVYEVRTENGIVCETRMSMHFADTFDEWLYKHIHFQKGCILSLTDLCQAYLGKSVGPRIMSKYKKMVENYIQQNFQQMNVNHIYQKGLLNEKSYRGWIDLQFIK